MAGKISDMLSNEELILTCDTGLFSERNTNYVFPCTLSRVRGFVYHQIKTILNHINAKMLYFGYILYDLMAMSALY